MRTSRCSRSTFRSRKEPSQWMIYRDDQVAVLMAHDPGFAAAAAPRYSDKGELVSLSIEPMTLAQCHTLAADRGEFRSASTKPA